MIATSVAISGEGLPGASYADDLAAIEACRAGDGDAFDWLVVRHQRDVYRLCYRYTNHAQDAQDLAQDVFVKAWRALPSFRGDSAFRTWLYRIAVNSCLNHRAARRPTVDLPETLRDTAERADVRIQREQRAVRVRAAVATLPERQRAALILKVWHELTHEQVAQALGTTAGTVKAHVFHALANLQKRLGDKA